MSIRWKIALLGIAIGFFPVYYLADYVVELFDRYTRTALEDQMNDYAFLAGEQYRLLVVQDPGGAGEGFSARLRQYAQEFKTRLCILDTNGVVQYDSSLPSAVGEDWSGQREVARAMEGRYGARNALTPDRAYMFYYIAIPIRDGASITGIAYAARNTAEITRVIMRMSRDFRLTMLSTIVISVLAAFLLAHTMTRRLRRLTLAATRFAEGDSALVVPSPRNDEIGELARAFTSMADEIARKNTFNRDLLADTAHELKSPLTAIKGAVQILADDPAIKPEDRKRFLGNIDKETERLINMVEQLTALTRLDAEDIRDKKQSVNYVTFVRETIERLSPGFDEPHAKLVMDLPDEEIEAHIYPERIEQVIANILENAFRFTPSDGSVTLSVRRDGDMVTTVISDTGPGIDPGDLPRVFDRFFTTEPGNVIHEYGSGLGLSIARSIVEKHGGTIRAESRPGEGARFIFSL